MAKYSKENLKDLCKANKVGCGGNKPDVVARLLSAVPAHELVASMTTLCEEGGGKFPSPALYVSGGQLTVSGSATAAQAPTTPPMEIDEFARLFHTIKDPSVFAFLLRAKQHRTRLELDGAPSDAWSEHVEALYNDSEFKPSRCAVVPLSLIPVTPEAAPRRRAGHFLKTKWADARRHWSVAYARYTKSGQSEPATGDQVASFANFIPSDVSALMKSAVLYAWTLFQHSPELLSYSARALPRSMAVEEGGGDEDDLADPQVHVARKRRASAAHDLATTIKECIAATAPSKRNKSSEEAETLETLARTAREIETMDRTGAGVRLLQRMLKSQSLSLARSMDMNLDGGDGTDDGWF